MQWFYANDRVKAGPVTDLDLEALVRDGTVKPETLVWRDGLADWVPYREAAAVLPNVPAAGAVGSLGQCAECNRFLPPDELIELAGAPVCASCKPLRLQKLKEGAPMSSGITRRRKLLITPLEPSLPARCVKCNVDVSGAPVLRKLSWHHPALYVVVLVNLLLYIILALAVSKRSRALVYLCPQHRAKRRNAIILAWVLFLGGIVVVFTDFTLDQPIGLWAVGLAMVLFGVIWVAVKAKIVTAAKIDKEGMRLSGCGPAFLDSFPESAK